MILSADPIRIDFKHHSFPSLTVTAVSIQWHGSDALNLIYSVAAPATQVPAGNDPGAGKTIMAGLLIKELIARADLKHCLVVCDEVHKMSATIFSGEVKDTVPYKLSDAEALQTNKRAGTVVTSGLLCTQMFLCREPVPL